jgi:hypothetical protein
LKRLSSHTSPQFTLIFIPSGVLPNSLFPHAPAREWGCTKWRNGEMRRILPCFRWPAPEQLSQCYLLC